MAIKEDYTLWLKIFQTLNEAQKRWFAAEKSLELGYGGVKRISELTGLSRTTIITHLSLIFSVPLIYCPLHYAASRKAGRLNDRS